MRILQVNKFHYPRGGADKYYLELGRTLEVSGHQVAYFSMKHPKNIASKWSQYFVSRLSFNEGGFLDKLKTPGRIIYSLEAKKKFSHIIKDFKPDVIHIHNIYHQLSPSILDVARQAKIPVVMHVHDYKLICPNYQLFAHGKICEACKPNKYWQCVKKRCFKNSCFKSSLAALEMHLHHNVWQIYRKNIDLFITPSQFMKNKLVEFSWPEDKIKVIVNPFSADLINQDVPAQSKSDYLLYFGRLSQEKGLETLITAAKLSQQKIKIVGSGPEENNLRTQVAKQKASVEFLGFKEGNELRDIILGAKAVVVPSIWYENMPLSMLEALSLGKVVIASKIGGLPEIIKDGENGYLFEAGSAQDLTRAFSLLETANLNEMSEKAKTSVKNFSPLNNQEQVEAVYQSLLK